MEISFFYLFVLFLIAYALTVVGVGFWRRLALKKSLLDIPNDRSSHVQPTPRGGGVVIFAVTISFLFLSSWQAQKLSEMLPFFLGASIIAIISWLDDLYGLPSILRLFVHAVGAFVAIWGIGFIDRIELPFLGVFQINPLLGQTLSVLWIIGLTNAYNFMDGIDGIAGTQALIAGAVWAVIGFLSGQPIIVYIGTLLAATNIGFLWHNWHPAKIFMGDVSSAFLGYTLAVLPILATKGGTLPPEKAALIGVLPVWGFVFDTTLTFIRRALKGENVLAAHRSHLYQRLVIAGYKHDSVSIAYGFLALVGATMAIFWLSVGQFVWIFILPVMALSLWCFVWKTEANLKKNGLPNKK